MSTIRITQRQIVSRSLTAMQTSAARVARSQELLSTGRLINRPSDSPTGTNTAMRLREQLAANAQYSRNASDGRAWLGRTDNTLTGMIDSTRRARELVLQGASTGSIGPQAREALATEIEQIRDSVLSLANTQHLGRPLFGGTTAGNQAYDPATGAYVGEPAPSQVSRTVGDGISVRINTTGPEAFDLNGTDLFGILADAADRLRTNPGQLSTTLDDLDAVMKKMTTALADVGTRYGRVDAALATVDSATLDLQSNLAEVENVDIAKAVVDLQLHEVAYQGALGATARVIQPSLLDFLR